MPSTEAAIPSLPLHAGRQRGLTLVELIVTIVVTGIALAALSATIASGIGRSPEILVQTQALALAQSYIDEILSKRFDENAPPGGIPPCHAAGTPCTSAALLGPEAGEARSSYDDVDDYHGLHEGYGSPGPQPLHDIDGLTRAGYEQFGIEIAVRYLDASENGFGILANDAKLITLTVSTRSHPEGWRFSAYKANF